MATGCMYYVRSDGVAVPLSVVGPTGPTGPTGAPGPTGPTGPASPNEIAIQPAAPPTTGPAVMWVDSDDPDHATSALVNGSWVTISGGASAGADEVFIGPTEPAAPPTELWFDTDAVGGSGTIVAPFDGVPAAIGVTRTPGVSGQYARGDHVHAPMAWTAWTPTVTQGVSVSLSTSSAAYMRLGDLVITNVYLVCSSSGTSGQRILVGGLPVPYAGSSYVLASVSGSGWVAVGTNYVGTWYGFSGGVVGLVANSSTDYIGQSPALQVVNGTSIVGMMMYRTA